MDALWEFRKHSTTDTTIGYRLEQLLFLYGRGQHMDPGSMDPHRGPGPWNTDHGPPSQIQG